MHDVSRIRVGISSPERRRYANVSTCVKSANTASWTILVHLQLSFPSETASCTLRHSPCCPLSPLRASDLYLAPSRLSVDESQDTDSHGMYAKYAERWQPGIRLTPRHSLYCLNKGSHSSLFAVPRRNSAAVSETRCLDSVVFA